MYSYKVTQVWNFIVNFINHLNTDKWTNEFISN